MPERDGYIPGVPCWIDIEQPDPAAAAAFYSDLFGWEVEDTMPEGADGHYLIGRIRGGDVGAISSPSPGATAPPKWNTYIWVDSADETAAKVRKAGGVVVAEPFDVFDAGRMAVLSDPEGAVFCAWQAGRHRGSRVVNEHGAVVFNTLATRDPDRAAEFYGAVFGWGRLHMPGGVMWTLPGYGDYLKSIAPEWYEGSSDDGIPEGFIDVVAALQRIDENDHSAPAEWSTTFGVDDVVATAAQAEKLGGRVVVAPFDSPWTRAAVIEDPFGATFVAGQFVPENRDLEA